MRTISALVLFTLAGAAIAGEKAPIDRFPIVRDGRYGFVDHTGKIVIEPKFFWASGFGDDGVAAVFACGRTEYIDLDGGIARLPEAGGKEAPDKAIWPAKSGEKVGFKDRVGQWVIPPKFDGALPFQEGLAAVQVGAKWGFIDRHGKLAIEPAFSQAFYFWGDRGQVKVGDEDVVIDRSGKTIYRGRYLFMYQEGVLAVEVGEKEGYIDTNGKMIIPPTFDSANYFSEGVAAVKVDGRYGYIDHSGTFVIRPQFDGAQPFSEGRAAVELGGREGLIDHSGSLVVPAIYDQVYPMPFGLMVVYFAPDDNSYVRFGYAKADGTFIWGPTGEVPSHGPLQGWSESDKKASYVPGFCEPQTKIH